MTELVRSTSLPQFTLTRRSCAGIVALSLALSLPAGVVRAAPADPQASAPADASGGVEASAEADAGADAAAPASDAPLPSVEEVESALAEGDLSSAKEQALARSEADPSADNLELEARVWEALGDYENATRAHAAALEALPEDDPARADIEARLAGLEADARGTRADEPASSHRERFDEERAARLAALLPKPPPPPVVDEPAPVPITKKWYFWVTLGALAASAGAIVGIAVAGATGEDASAGGEAARQPVVPLGGAAFRF